MGSCFLGDLVIKDYRLNYQIKAPKVRLIDENGVQVGVLSFKEAITMAQSKNLDLVEIVPSPYLPVCKLINYDKFRYEQKKKEQEAKKKQVKIEIKEIRLFPNIGSHDLETKINQARKFLERSKKVRFNIFFRGRESTHRDIGERLIQQVSEALKDIGIIEQQPVFDGSKFTLIFSPQKKQ